jgi:hypothetical protein
MKLRRTEHMARMDGTGNNGVELSLKSAVLKTEKVSIKPYLREAGREDASWIAGSESYPKQVRIL